MPGTLHRRRRRGALLVLLGVATLAGCATNPVTGERELALISEEQEIAMGRQSAQEVAQTLGLVDDEALQQYVQRVGADLAADTERPDLPWTFRVVDDPTPNAFALPGGFIFVTRGMMTLMNSEAELASVLGHEIGHVTARHSVQQLSRAQLAQLGLGLGAILAPEIAQQYGQLASTGLQLLFLKYSRDDERQADELGFRYALQDNYDVREFADVFADLQRLSQSSDASPVPGFLSTHPDPGERVQTAERRVAALDRPLTNAIVDRAEYLQQIEGLAYGQNPRNGFFRDGAFIHPDLRFRLDFPARWQTQNLPQAVVAVSPEQDAVVQLELSPAPDAVSAARAFLSQQGIQAGQTFQQPINGVPAAGSYFQAQTEQGVVEGLAAFFTYDGHTYRLLSYAPAGRFAAYDPVARQIIGSFRPLTDPQLLNIQPPRVAIVRITEPMTLAAFDRRYPSTVPLDELALINELSGPDATLEAGTMVKRVVE
ncbi:MAG TPA: M48 family metalloprotease [Gemmatimonadaceae bacterium]|nr:M48 family metalloprotease [Gemmatimonadaceae bacterium]